MAVRKNREGEMAHSWSSAVAKAYRQVSQMIEQFTWIVVVQWCPKLNGSVFIGSLGQLFRGKTPPQNLSRHPAWWCYLMAPMFGPPLQHTVDDVIATERIEVVNSGNQSWREITRLTGWDIPDSKSPYLLTKPVYLVLMFVAP